LNAYFKIAGKNVKVDFLAHKYPLLFPVEKFDNIDFLSVPDVAAMKLNAIIGRGSKKDFYDIYELLEHYSLNDLVEFYKRKYPNFNPIIILKSLQYFNDAENTPAPITLNELEWDEVKEKIIFEVKKYIDNL